MMETSNVLEFILHEIANALDTNIIIAVLLVIQWLEQFRNGQICRKRLGFVIGMGESK